MFLHIKYNELQAIKTIFTEVEYKTPISVYFFKGKMLTLFKLVFTFGNDFLHQKNYSFN